MTTTIKTTLRAKDKFGTTLFLAILVDGAVIGEAMLVFDYDEDGDVEYRHLERLDIDEDPSGKGYVSAAIEAIRAIREDFGFFEWP